MTPEEIKALTPEQIAAILAEMDDQLNTAASLIGEQSSKIDKLSKGNKSIKPSVKVGDFTYDVIHGVKFNGVVYSAQAIAENADVAAKLVADGSTALVAQEDEE
jgi:hypothetical protein